MITTTRNEATTAKVMALGFLLAALMAASLVLAEGRAHASTTFTVNSTEDHADAILGIDGCDTGYDLPGTSVPECTLRAAIEQANYATGEDTIDFAIPGSDVQTIAPSSALPEITGPVTINGYSQPGAKPNTKAVGTDAVLKIELSGASYPVAHGLSISASNSTIKGLVINRWGEGISIIGSGATGNKITGNYLGTDATGTQDLGNTDKGVLVADAPNNVIGGTTAAARNLTSGNDVGGISIGGADATGNKVMGNYVGTDASGTKNLGNAEGVLVGNAPNNVVGGATAGERNVISGNKRYGVLVYGAEAIGNKVSGNFIGTDASGTNSLGNFLSGVRISDSSNNTVGGATAAGRNVISGNQESGVSIYGAGATGNSVLQNSIFSNGGLGIDLGADGPTANDPGDADTGPNNLQNKPTVSSAKTGSLKTTIRGTLNSVPNRTFAVRLFSNPSGGDEGKTFIGTISVRTDGSGKGTFAFSPAQKVALGRTITATATSPGGSTSEFSAARTVVAP